MAKEYFSKDTSVPKWGIMVRNTGMWGGVSWCHHDGITELYDSEEEAKEKAKQYNEAQGRVNVFNHYFASRYE